MSLESKRTRMKSGFLFICTVIRSLFHNHSSFRKKAELSSQPLSPTPLVRTGIATLPFPVKPGDLVWCLMPLSEKELKTVPEGHELGLTGSHKSKQSRHGFLLFFQTDQTMCRKLHFCDSWWGYRSLPLLCRFASASSDSVWLSAGINLLYSWTNSKSSQQMDVFAAS